MFRGAFDRPSNITLFLRTLSRATEDHLWLIQRNTKQTYECPLSHVSSSRQGFQVNCQYLIILSSILWLCNHKNYIVRCLVSLKTALYCWVCQMLHETFSKLLTSIGWQNQASDILTLFCLYFDLRIIWCL
jgi:hypothetical protein